MKKLLKVLGITVSIIILGLIGALIYFNNNYPKVNPPKNIKIIATPEKIARGEYLANHVAICMDCHSTRDWMRFAGPVVSGTEGKGGEKFDESMGFPGTIYAKNITPAAIGNWTDGDLLRAITMGVNKQNEALFPMMPYMNFSQLTQDDLESIIAYVRTLKPIKNTVPKSELNFPVNLIVKTLPLQSYKSPKPVDKNNPVEYGKYLVTMASCADCHTPSEKGAPIQGMDFAGGHEWNIPSGILRTANITPDTETGIGSWSKETFIARFKSFDSDSAKHIPANFLKEYNTIMPWTMFAGMTEEDLGDIYEYLRTVKPVKNRVEKFTPAKNQFANAK